MVEWQLHCPPQWWSSVGWCEAQGKVPAFTPSLLERVALLATVSLEQLIYSILVVDDLCVGHKHVG